MLYILQYILYSIITTNGKIVKLSHPEEHSTKREKLGQKNCSKLNYSLIRKNTLLSGLLLYEQQY